MTKDGVFHMHDDDPDADYLPALPELPVSEWTDTQIRAGLVACAQLNTEMTHHVAVILAEERDKRVKIYRDIEDAMCPVKAGSARILFSSI